MSRKCKGATTGLSIPLNVTADEFAKAAESQRKKFRELADHIENGKALDSSLDRALAGQALRAFANSIPTNPKRGRGRPAKVPAGDVSLLFAAYRRTMSYDVAILRIAKLYAVPEDTIASAVKK